MFIIYQATRSILNISCLLLLGSTELWMGKSRSDGLEILGDQKVAPVARGFRVQVKIFSKKCQKTSRLTNYNSTTIKDSFKPEYYSVPQAQVSMILVALETILTLLSMYPREESIPLASVMLLDLLIMMVIVLCSCG